MKRDVQKKNFTLSDIIMKQRLSTGNFKLKVKKTSDRYTTKVSQVGYDETETC